MAPAAPFNPPAADLPGKPFVPEWVPPPVTKETHNFAQLKSIDLSLLDSEDPAIVNNLIQQVKQAIRDDGFLFLENYGISLEQVSDSNVLLKCTSRLTATCYSSSTASLLLHSISTITLARRTRSVYYSAQTLVFGQDTSTPMGLR